MVCVPSECVGDDDRIALPIFIPFHSTRGLLWLFPGIDVGGVLLSDDVNVAVEGLSSIDPPAAFCGVFFLVLSVLLVLVLLPLYSAVVVPVAVEFGGVFED